MIIWGALGIPLFAIILLLIFFRKKMTAVEYAAVFLVPLVIITICKFVATEMNITSTEYMAYYISKVSYYEPWDEEVPCTHSYDCNCTTDKDGHEHCSTCYRHSYDVDYHPEHWSATLNNGDEVTISKSTYIYCKTLFKASSIFVELNRDYHSIDGDRYDDAWGGENDKMTTYYTHHSYPDKIRNHSNNVYKFIEIDKLTADKLHLISYPTADGVENLTVLSSRPNSIYNVYDTKASRLNCLTASQRQLKLWILIFNGGETKLSGMMQEQYWKRGNKNEFVVCLGMDSATSSLKWFHTFTWSDKRKATVDLTDFLLSYQDKGQFPMMTFIDHLDENMADFKRKSFSDFNYITVEPSLSAVIWAYVLTLLITLGVSIYSVRNEFES